VIAGCWSRQADLILVPLLLAVARMATRDWRRLRPKFSAAQSAPSHSSPRRSYGSFAVCCSGSRANEFYHRLPTRTERNVTPLLMLFTSTEPAELRAALL
jgi:hypothetical protein